MTLEGQPDTASSQADHPPSANMAGVPTYSVQVPMTLLPPLSTGHALDEASPGTRGVFNSLTAECRENDPGPAPADAHRNLGTMCLQEQDLSNIKMSSNPAGGREQDRAWLVQHPCWTQTLLASGTNHSREPRPGLHQKPA